MKKLTTLTRTVLSMSVAVMLISFLSFSAYAQTLTTDQGDYAPGSVATLTGSGFSSGETVSVQVLHNPTGGDDATSAAHQPWDVTADGDGGFTTTWTVPNDEDEEGASLIATADGQTSGSHAEATFTDHAPLASGTVTVTATNGSCLGFTSGNGGGPDDWEVAEGGTYHMAITGVTECSGSVITVNIQSSNGGNWCFDATQTGANTYEGDFTVPSPGCFTMPISYSCGSQTNCGNAGDYNAMGPNGSSVHLRYSTFSNGCGSFVNDEDCNPPCEPVSVSISANGATTFCQGGSVQLCASGAASYSWSTGESTDCITVSPSGTTGYSVTGAGAGVCANTTGVASATVTVNPPPTVSISANGPTTFCQGGSVQLCATGASTYAWSNGATGSCITVSSAGTYSAVGTDANGCSAGSNSISVTVNPNPTCNITNNNPTVVCGLSYTASVTTNGNTVLWSVSGTGWSIVGSTTSTSVTYKAGPGTGTLSVTVKFTATGCTSTCSTGITANCTEGCSYTQGFYGGTGKNCQQQVALTAINAALTQGAIVTGTAGHSITFGTSEGSCIKSHMPAGTTPTRLAAGDVACAGATGSAYLNSGKFKSALLGQVLALKLSMRNSSSLGSVVVSGPYLTTYKATACTNGVAVPGTKLVKGPIPSSVLTAIGSGGTVATMWSMANSALGNAAGTPSYSDWTAALDAINNGFDGCRILAGFGTSSGGLKLETNEEAAADNSISGLSIYPNPTKDQLTISFVAPSGKTSVDVYNISGILVYHSEATESADGISVQQHLDVSSWADGVYFVRINSTDNSVVGKVIVNK